MIFPKLVNKSAIDKKEKKKTNLGLAWAWLGLGLGQDRAVEIILRKKLPKLNLFYPPPTITTKKINHLQ